MIPKNQTELEILQRLQKLENAAFDYTFEERYGESQTSIETSDEE